MTDFNCLCSTGDNGRRYVLDTLFLQGVSGREGRREKEGLARWFVLI